MIRLSLDEMTLRGTRIAVSPLWECLSSLALLARYRGEVPFPYTNWARQARAALPDLVRAELLDLTRALHPSWLPSFVVPVPTTPGLEITDELATLSARVDDGRLDRFAALAREYWHAALAPYWPSMRNVLEEEILFRGHRLATEGADAMLADLGGRVRWERPVLYAPYQIDLDRRLDNAQLFIVPVLFARGMRILSSPLATVTAMSYQARGAGVLAEHPTGGPARDVAPERGDRLAILVGRGRAAVMRALAAPTTTTAVASALGLAPSTVSQHLSALSSAGVVRRKRAGYRVLYELDHVGVALLEHVDAHTS